MIPSAFEYHSPTSVEDAIGLLGQYGDDAKLLAGGHSLIPLMKLRLAAPEHLIDLGRVQGLSYIREEGGTIAIGAMTTHAAVAASELLRSRLPVLAEAAASIGDVQVRNRGTIGGSIAHADPAAELTAVLTALGGDVTVVGPGGTRAIAAADLFVTYLTTSLDARELLTEVRFPALPAGAGWSWMEIARRHGDFALAGVGVVLALGGGVIADARIALTGVGPTPVRASQAERLLVRRAPSEGLWAEAAEAVRAAIDPDGDIHASAEYRKHVAGVLTQRALREALARVEAAA